MSAAEKPLTLDEFFVKHSGTRCEFYDGVVVGEGRPLESQATSADHGSVQAEIVTTLNSKFGRGNSGGYRWWFVTEAAVRYGTRYFLCHDLAGWRKSRLAKRPTGFPITSRPDWVCEILSSNLKDDLVRKKNVLHEFEVPYYWIVSPLEKTLSIFEWAEVGYVSVLDAELGFEGALPPFLDAGPLSLRELFGLDEDEA